MSEKSSGQGEALFQEVRSEHSGVYLENKYADPSMWGERFLEFSLGALGTGVAVGDFDRDGLPDLYLASKTESNRLFRNLGNWQFEDLTETAGVAGSTQGWCQGVAFVDYDNDGWLDIYECRYNSPNRLYRNNGDGTFINKAIRAGVNVRDASGMASFADFDRDGYLDFYLQTNLLSLQEAPSGQEDYLFRNRGDGTFENVTRKAGISGAGQGHSATWIDYNQDGYLDLYVANDFTPSDRLYHNVGDGRFVDVLSYVVAHTPNSSMGADIADLNNDGLIDFMVADMAARTREKDMRGMVDGRGEAVDPHSNPFAAQQYPRNVVYLNSGMGPFFEAAHLMGLEATDWTWSLRFEDFDNDGWSDLHVTTGMIRELHNTDLMSKVRRARSPQQRVALVEKSPPLLEKNLAFRNTGNLSFEEIGNEWGLDEIGISFGAATGDFDLDGDLDLVYGNYQGNVTLMRNDSLYGNRIVLELRGQDSNYYGIGANVEIQTSSGKQFKTLSLSRGYLSTSEPIVHFGLGSDESVKRLEVQWPSGTVQVLENLEAGYRYQIEEEETAVEQTKENPIARLAFSEASRELELLHRTRESVIDERRQQPLLPRRGNRVGPALAIGDLNGDGREDLVVGGTALDPATIFLQNESGSYPSSSAIHLQSRGSNDGPILVFDGDGDGDLDLIRTASGVSHQVGHESYRIEYYENDGRAVFVNRSDSMLPAISMAVGTAAAADVDNDGDIDLFLGGGVLPGRYPEPYSNALLLNEDGRFRLAKSDWLPESEGGGALRSSLFTDINSDGWPDLLVAGEWSAVRCWINRGLLGGFEDATERYGFDSGGTGWWNSLVSGDFNGDGKLDYAAGNLGLNTPYSATEREPAKLLAGKLENRDVLIEVEHEEETMYPMRGYNVLRAELPTLSSRLRGNDAYAVADLRDVVGDEFLQSAQSWEATQFASGVFMSQGNDTYEFRPFPRLAQVAPIYGMAAVDMDGDGRLDLYLMQNDYAPIPSAGRFDGGLSLTLLGRGDGEFEAVLPGESGLLVTGDAKALVNTDIDDDGDPDFILSRNNSSVLIYRNDSPQPARRYWIDLQDWDGRQNQAGTIVKLILSNGKEVVRELYCGSGYLSQSSQRLFFAMPTGVEIEEIQVRRPGGEWVKFKGPFEQGEIVLGWGID
ncbi:VCBS repeat-containing protein [Pelagicoccus albus]|uniref:VCBS repeat-containing protein n=1 Tax=Pelagicoccus albus TaxID=415222 RepID=A0A7X1E9B2_9BACT|nr:FG-GAP-like repeat-containing protein [Pelagicoccus albus]MBC2607146.1 VCBS repeat-containing protein [Pelagicoccus albus]